MIKHLLLLCGLYVAAVLETDPAFWRLQTPVVICPLYLLACLCAWTSSQVGAAVWGAVTGLAADALAAGPLGMETILVASLCWSAAHLRIRYEWKSLLAFCLFSLALIGGLSVTSALLRGVALRQGVGISDLLSSCTAAAFPTALCGLLLLTAGRLLSRVRRSTAVNPY